MLQVLHPGGTQLVGAAAVDPTLEGRSGDWHWRAFSGQPGPPRDWCSPGGSACLGRAC